MNASSSSHPSLNNKKSGKEDDDLDEDDSEDEIVVQHRSKSVAMRRKVLVLDDSEDDVTDSDIEFTTEDVKEEDEDDAFEDALDASFSESSNKNELVVPFSSMTPTLRSSSSSDEEEGEFETPIIETVVKRPTARKEKTTERGGGAGKISLFQAFRSPEAKRAFATTTPSRTATSAAKP